MFDPREATISTIHTALSNGTTALEIAQAHLARIAVLNPLVNAIITLSPNALQDAAAIDGNIESLKWSPQSHKLLGVPVILKDAYDLAGVPTTGGCLALADSVPSQDGAVVQALKKAGAVILGKANQHELALEGLTVSSLGGQTLNPFDLTRTPGGSSGGSAVAVAMSFAVLATGGDTMNSMRSPASATSVFSVRPTRGLVSRTGVMPLSDTQDSLGPFAKTVRDVATMLEVMRVGVEDGDDATKMVPESVWEESYTDGLESKGLRGKRIGVVEGFFDRREERTESRPVNKAMDGIVEKLTEAGVEVVSITDKEYSADTILRDLDTQVFEFREQTDSYLQSDTLHGDRPLTLQSLIDSQRFMVIPLQHAKMRSMLSSTTASPEYASVQQGIRELRSRLLETFTANRLDALVYPQQKNLVVTVGSPSQSGRNGMLAAVTGFPVVTVPAGFSAPSYEAPRGVPIGMELLGLPWMEKSLLQLAWQVERVAAVRQVPSLADQAVPTDGLQVVPHIQPQRAGMPDAYPVGVL